MTAAVIAAFFHLWARQMGCADVTMLPPQEFIAAPWLVRIESADACGHILQLFDSIYIPQNESKNLVPLVDGERVYNAPNIHVILYNLTT